MSVKRKKLEISPTQQEELYDKALQLEESKNYVAARRTLFVLAKIGHRGAQLNLGYQYDCGLGVRINKERAMYWYKKCALGQDASAANNIAILYREKKRLDLSIRWFEKAIDWGNDDALLRLAEIFMHTPKKQTKALELLKRLVNSESACEFSVEKAKNMITECAKGARVVIK